MAKAESRFGFGQFAGLTGIALVGAGLTQPWLRLDLPAAFQSAMTSLDLPRDVRASVLQAGGSADQALQLKDSALAARLGQELGIAQTGWAQQQTLAIAVAVLLVLALVGVIRSVLAESAWAARANAPLLALAGFGTLAAAGAELWVLAPEPQIGMRPDTGLYLLAGGAVALLLGGLTLGNNRRRPFLDDIKDPAPPRTFDGADHLAYSHGAWVPRGGGHREQGPRQT